jgi:hypothetical protein
LGQKPILEKSKDKKQNKTKTVEQRQHNDCNLVMEHLPTDVRLGVIFSVRPTRPSTLSKYRSEARQLLTLPSVSLLPVFLFTFYYFS